MNTERCRPSSRPVARRRVEVFYLADDGLMVVPSGRDPQLFFDLPSTLQTRGHSRTGALLPLALVFVGVLLAGLVLERCFEQGDTLVVVCLAMVFVLIACMATLSRVGVHPDEGVHVRAADYFQQHVLPPPVGAPDIRNTYSVYGVSRLHSGEIAYLLLGKCARLFHALALPSYIDCFLLVYPSRQYRHQPRDAQHIQPHRSA